MVKLASATTARCVGSECLLPGRETSEAVDLCVDPLRSIDMANARHCQHCLGDCPGDCLLPGSAGLCIHNPTRGMALRDRLMLLGTRKFWRRVFWGRG